MRTGELRTDGEARGGKTDKSKEGEIVVARVGCFENELSSKRAPLSAFEAGVGENDIVVVNEEVDAGRSFKKLLKNATQESWAE